MRKKQKGEGKEWGEVGGDAGEREDDRSSKNRQEWPVGKQHQGWSKRRQKGENRAPKARKSRKRAQKKAERERRLSKMEIQEIEPEGAEKEDEV